MSENKMPCLIKDVVRRKVTMSKRKRGLFKKAIELSRLCGAEVLMAVFDTKNQKLFELTSQPEFNLKVVNHLLDKVNLQQFLNNLYTNDDYNKFDLNKMIKTLQGIRAMLQSKISKRREWLKTTRRSREIHLKKLK